MNSFHQGGTGGHQRLPLCLDVAKDSDSASDYERSFRQTQRDDLRLLRRSDLREPSLPSLREAPAPQ